MSGYPRLPIRRPLSLHVNGDEGPAQFYFRWAVATENRRRCRICVPAVAGFEAVCRKRKYNDWIGLRGDMNALKDVALLFRGKVNS